MVRRLLFVLVISVVCALAIPVLLLRPKTRPGLRARLGWPRIDENTLPGGPRVWVHAASAGDVKNVWPLVRALKEARPEVAIILSVVTNTGHEMARQIQPAPDAITFLPLDAPPFVRGALNAIRPDVLLLECTELWPTLIRTAHARGVRIGLTNGRVSERSARRYRRFFPWSGNPLPHFSALCLQTHEDRTRYESLGAPAANCVVTGNCKFDAAARRPPAEKVEALRDALGRPERILVAGSTHVGEEDIILDAYQRARSSAAGLKLLWAPRYLEHVDDLVNRSRARGLAACRRTAGPDACRASDVIILDTMGELAGAYAIAEVAIVGGSFVQRGGQNILEPAAQGIPVLHGPDMRLAPDQAQALDGRGAITVDRAALPDATIKLLEDPAERARLGTLGAETVRGLAGSATRHLEVILPLIPPR